MEESAISMVKKQIRDMQDRGKKFYTYIMVDLDDVTIIIERFGRALKRLFGENGIKPQEVQLYAFSSTDSEKIKQHCARGNFRFYLKPGKAGYLDVLRHMAEEEDVLEAAAAAGVTVTPGEKSAKKKNAVPLKMPDMVKVSNKEKNPFLPKGNTKGAAKKK
mmetsp:Transcript_30724/g.47112  ORF Transcript_30724/g.47112 Transcript_30724/m.47112 type:complete len:161 (+) Transcript_30724:2140-2622(+)